MHFSGLREDSGSSKFRSKEEFSPGKDVVRLAMRIDLFSPL